MTEPIIGIDPGRVTGIAVDQGAGNNITGAHLLRGMPWKVVLDAFLPAHVFIEQPVGDNERTLKLWEQVNGNASLLRPFDRKRQLIPPKVWRAEILSDGDATKSDAVKWVREHYPSLKGQPLSHDVAEAVCLAVYGRRLLTDSLRRGKPPLPASHVPECELQPAVRRGKGTGKRGRPANAFRLGRAVPDDPAEPPTDLYDHIPPLRSRWRVLAEEGGAWLYTIMRVWVSGYVFVGEYAACRVKPVTWRAWATDAHASQSDLKPAIAALYDAGLVRHDVALSQPRRRRKESPVPFRPDAPLLFVPVADDLTRPFLDLFRAHVKRVGKDGKSSNYAALIDRWDEQREPAFPPSDWASKIDRDRRERLFPHTCGMCGSRNVPPWADPDDPLCVAHCDDTRDDSRDEPTNPPHGDDDHENDGHCRACDKEAAAFLAECDAEVEA